MDPKWFVTICFILSRTTSHIGNVAVDPLFYLHHAVRYGSPDDAYAGRCAEANSR